MVTMRGTNYLITKYEEKVLIISYTAVAKRYFQNFSEINRCTILQTASSKHPGEMIKRGKQE